MPRRRAWYPAWVRTVETRFAWDHSESWQQDAFAHGNDPAQRLRLLNEASRIYQEVQQKEEK
ncbi:MAG TPA: hypothetical protein VKX46_16695 [Ktedonobacteraceae bacterium]|nr:hypothetical protein [Ktedonobacteraceae bacterium]